MSSVLLTSTRFSGRSKCYMQTESTHLVYSASTQFIIGRFMVVLFV